LGHDPQGEWIDLRHLVDECIKDVEAMPKDVRLEIAMPADFPQIYAERSLLKLVFSNLIRNAMDALENNPTSDRFLAVQARHDQRMATVTISDTGAGMSPALAQGCFEPFVTTKNQGMGLGLALSRWIVETHGGRLSVSPHAPRGTSFHVALPLAGELPHHEKPATQCRPGG
jgi:two-component system sensor kinase FixL